MNLLTADYILALYNAVMISVWAPFAWTSGAARWLLGVHAVALSLPWLLTRAGPMRPGFARALRDIYPLLWVAAFWREVGIHTRLVGTAPYDAFVVRLDRALFGVNLNATWAPAVGVAWVGDLMQFLYFSYYFLLVPLTLYLLVRGPRPVVHDVALRVSAVYVAAYLVYAFAPSVGPLGMTLFPRFEGPGTHGLFRLLNDAFEAAGESHGTAFPSTHVAGAVTFAWLAWRHAPRPIAWLATVFAAGIPPATVYTQNHFLVDAVAGAVLGLGVQALVGLPPLTAPHRPLEPRPELRQGSRVQDVAGL